MSTKLMTEAHKHRISKNRIHFLQNLTSIDSLINILCLDYTLTNELREEIESKQTKQAKVSSLLDNLIRRSDNAFYRFVYALVETGNDHLAIMLDSEAAGDYIKKRDKSRPSTGSDTANITAMSSSSFQPALPFSPAYNGMFPGYGPPVNPYMALHMQQQMALWNHYYPGYPAGGGFAAPAFNMRPSETYMGAVPEQKYSVPVEEIDESKNNQDLQRMVADFKREVESDVASPVMNIDVQPIDLANASRIINSEICYEMTKRVRGRAVVISNKHFTEKRHKLREGTEFDEQNLQNLFTKLSFDTILYKDKTAKEISDTLAMERQKAQGYNAFVVFIMSHGNSGNVFGSDGEKVNIDDLTEMFDGQHCPSLRGKPKLFFIQACQGIRRSSDYQTDSVLNEAEGNQKSVIATCSEDDQIARQLQEMRIEDPVGFAPQLPAVDNSSHEKADMLIAYATVKDYESWRHSMMGSWFVRSLVYVFCRRAHQHHLLDMLTEANFLMSHLRTNGTDQPYRQVAEKRDTFLKKFYFFPNYFVS